MSKQAAYFRESGRGPAVVCMHAGYGASGQWRSLAQCLEDRFRVIACDMSGSGKSPPTPAGTQYTLSEEVSFLASVFDAAGQSFMAGAGHMAPLTDSDRVNRPIEAFLQEVAELGP